ncbi:MAG: response regulator transcription factor [Coriobacteriales bacterium]|nr:response regulator transcription factor [Coriobacteriales bacterium]
MDRSILIVDDDESILSALNKALKREGFKGVRSARSVSEAADAVGSAAPAVIVVSRELAQREGDDAARLRDAAPDTPVLFIRSTPVDPRMSVDGARDSQADGPNGFDAAEMISRIWTVLRRESWCKPPCIDFGYFQLHPVKRRLVVDGVEVSVPSRQLDLLVFLAQPPGAIYSAGTLYREVWGDDPIGVSDTNTVSVHVHRLREKIEPDPSNPKYLMTVRGLGYKLVQPTPSERAAEAGALR